jgi:hypothetical protein
VDRLGKSRGDAVAPARVAASDTGGASLPGIDALPETTQPNPAPASSIAIGGTQPPPDPEQPELLAQGAPPSLSGAGVAGVQWILRAPQPEQTTSQHRFDTAPSQPTADLLAAFQVDASGVSPLVPASAIPVGSGQASRSLESEALARELEALRDEVNELASIEFHAVAASAAASLGLSVGYVIWLLRGGALVTSMLSSLPAWRLVDPLPILGHLDDNDGDDPQDESLESMVSRRDADLPANRAPRRPEGTHP